MTPLARAQQDLDDLELAFCIMHQDPANRGRRLAAEDLLLVRTLEPAFRAHLEKLFLRSPDKRKRCACAEPLWPVDLAARGYQYACSSCTGIVDRSHDPATVAASRFKPGDRVRVQTKTAQLIGEVLRVDRRIQPQRFPDDWVTIAHPDPLPIDVPPAAPQFTYEIDLNPYACLDNQDAGADVELYIYRAPESDLLPIV